MWTRLTCIVYLSIFLSPVLGRGGGRGGGGYGSSRGGGRGHSYPHSTGYSGTGTGGSHTYPQSTGLSGHGNSYNNRPTVTRNYETHHHYHYNPPQQVHYPGYGSSSHPVYHGQPPVYVYSYRDSGSRFDTLLTGLALYNLGRMSSSHSHHYDYDRNYRSSPGEVCKLGIKRENGNYEETRVECRIMTSFILDSQTENQPVATNHVTTTVTNTTTVNGGNQTVSVTVVSDAMQVKGPSIQVTPGMECYMIHVTQYSTKRNSVPCGLLKAYAESSMRRNGAIKNVLYYECLVFAVLLCALKWTDI